MCHPPSRMVARLAVAAALIVTAAAAAALGPVSLAAAAPVSEPPGSVWGPGCPSPNPPLTDGTRRPDWDSSPAWFSSVGDYVGPGGDGLNGWFEGNCNGSMRYILDQATETAEFRWHLDLAGRYRANTSSCHLWAYIPSEFAGDRHARYDFWADDGAGHRRWLGWPGRTIDQETTAGWVDLGGVNLAFVDLLTVTLSNKDSLSPGWYAGAGDLAVANCLPLR